MDALVILFFIALLVYLYKDIGWWPYFWGGLGVFLGIFEAASVYFTGHTISQQFWQYQQLNPITGYWLAGAVVLFGIVLAVHLVWKQLRRK